MIMEKVKKGDTIRIIRMNDDGGKDLQARMYNGRSGVVEYIDSLGQLHGTWGGLAINPEIDDFKLYALNEYWIAYIQNLLVFTNANDYPSRKGEELTELFDF